jgi:cytochrome P450
MSAGARPGALPAGPALSGPLQALAWLARPVPFLLRAHAQLGDVFTIRLPQEAPWVVLAHPDAVREVFTGPPAALLAGEGNEVLRPVLGARSVLLLDGPEHLRARRMLLPPFHGERMQRYGDLMREVAEQEVASWPADSAFPLAPRMQAVTLEIILRAVFGVRVGAAKERLRDALEELLTFMARPAAFAAIVLLGPRRASRIPAFRRVVGRVDRLVREEIAARRAVRDLEARDDILSLLLQARDPRGDPLTDDELRDELVTLLVAGHETTATALSWAVERGLRTPGVMDRLRDELAAGDTAYLRAVCHETLRLRPVLPVVLRRLAEPMRIAGHDLPAGVKAAPCISLVHRRPDVYLEPHRFRPERFLDAVPGTYTWIPFGGGVRRCLGASFALFEMQAVLAAIATRTSLRPAAPASERTARRSITFAPAGGAAVVRVAA